MVTQEFLKEHLRYEPETGEFYWRKPGRKRVLSRPAGSVAASGYRSIRVNGRLHYAHRLAFLYMTGALPDNEVDHINGDPSDNRWSNLRLATREQNVRNTARPSHNSSGYKGVTWYAPGKKWRAVIQVDGRQRSLGYYETREQAHQAYVAAARKFYGGFARVA